MRYGRPLAAAGCRSADAFGRVRADLARSLPLLVHDGDRVVVGSDDACENRRSRPAHQGAFSEEECGHGKKKSGLFMWKLYWKTPSF